MKTGSTKPTKSKASSEKPQVIVETEKTLPDTTVTAFNIPSVEIAKVQTSLQTQKPA
jgi:hypothetical protein